jgi:hypothetical protein
LKTPKFEKTAPLDLQRKKYPRERKYEYSWEMTFRIKK